MMAAYDATAPAGGSLTLGFMPLVDCAILVVAREKGFARAEGLDLNLARETSWANIRDRVALGHFDAAHMLGPMPIAASLGIGRAPVATVAPFALGLGGNAITLAAELFGAMRDAAADPNAFARFEPAAVGHALAGVIGRRRAAGHAPPTIAVVHPFSAHHYEVRYWLHAVGVDPDTDVQITVLPPAAMGPALRERRIDGFCAGEPWGSIAVEAGLGVMAVVKSALWRQGPDKVLGLRADFTARYPEVVAALLRALFQAARWAGDPSNGGELAALLAGEAYLATPSALIARALASRLVRSAGAAPAGVPDFLVLDRYAATFPWLSHALWFYAQMVRWGHAALSPDAAAAARRSYRPDLYRAALAPLGADLPRADMKVEGALQHLTPVASRSGRLMLGPDGFFDGRLFDPDHLDQYVASFGERGPLSAE